VGVKRLNVLTVAQIRATKPGDVLHDGGGLIFERTDGGVRWTFRYTSPVTRKRRETGLGPVTLKEARERADDLRAIVRAGRDPLLEAEQRAAAEREAAAKRAQEAERNAATLASVAHECHRTIRDDFRNAKHRRQWIASLETNIPPKVWHKPVGQVTTADLLDVLLPLSKRAPETARRVRMRLAAIFQAAMLHNVADDNPAERVKSQFRRKRRSADDVPHLRALPVADVPALVAALRESERVSLNVRLCALFALATAARSGEARGATWGEIDREARTWSIAGNRMKGGSAHVVPLSEFALGLLSEADALRAHDGPDALVFPAPRERRRPLSDMSLTVALRRLPTGRARADGEPETFGHVTTMHGAARASFSSWGNRKARAPADLIEACLAHKESAIRDRVRAAYNRPELAADALEEFERDRRDLLARWAAYIAAERGKVVPLRWEA